MALDLYAGEHREQVNLHDEQILQRAAAQADRFPQLSAMWAAFYDAPRISSQQANELVHELVLLLTLPELESNTAIVRRGLRLAGFFSAAHRSGLDVRSVSD